MDVKLVATAPGLVEFLSLVRKLRTRGSLSEAEAERVFASLAGGVTLVAMDEHDGLEGYALATQLGQSDTFDATGYVVARRLGAEFWVSDRRFANMATEAGLPGIRYEP